MNQERLLYDVVVGYMLKVIKSGTRIIKFKEEFNAIKHGDYINFIELIKKPIPKDIVLSRGGVIIPSRDQLNQKNVDFLFLLLAAPSLNSFCQKCLAEFGNIEDDDITDKYFEQLANFEMVLRMHFNNIFESNNRVKLVDIINSLLKEKKIDNQQIKIVQKGRDFLNMVKGYKTKFISYKEGLIAFDKALIVLRKHNIT